MLNNLPSDGSHFVYNLDDLKTHADHMMQSIEHYGIKIWYACKANPLRAILQTLRSSQFHFDVASEGELLQVLKLGIPGRKILMTGPARPERLLRLALQNQVGVFVIESEAQLDMVQKLSPGYGYVPRILLRVQLQWNIGQDNILGGTKITHFGVDVPTAKELVKKIKLPFLGFHVFQWGNVLSLEQLASIWQKTIDVCKTIAPDFKVLDVGGGLGIPYHGEEPLKWKDVVDKIKAIKVKNNLEEFWLELGRYMIGPHGSYFTKVVDRKTIYGKQILVLESGINHIAKSALHNDWYPAFLVRESNAPKEKFSLHGPLCMAADFLGDHSLPNDVKIGDTIMMKQVGSYGFTQSMPFMLCHDLAGEAVIQNGRLTVVRKPQAAASWLNLEQGL